MNYLLDTCTFLWLTLNHPQLSNAARQAIVNPANTAFFSVVSTWEICIKHSSGKLPLPLQPEQFVPMQRSMHRIISIGFDEPDVYWLRHLPALHKDPFDRMLVCQALALNLTILTPDPKIQQYPVPVLW